jgi:hypothetical protein
MCKNSAVQYITHGYGYREVETRCGSTGMHGQVLLCDECMEKAEQDHPQGWRNVPGDICEHGTYVGDAGGPDYMCPECESW